MENKQETWKIPKEVQTEQKSLKNHDGKNTEHIKLFIKGLEIDVIGIAGLQGLKAIPVGLLSKGFRKKIPLRKCYLYPRVPYECTKTCQVRRPPEKPRTRVKPSRLPW